MLHIAKDGDTYLPSIVPVLVARLGQTEIMEPSEELRLELVNLLNEILKVHGPKMGPFMGDMVLILQRTVVDPYPEVKKVILCTFMYCNYYSGICI